jgi:hypothetical protein
MTRQSSATVMRRLPSLRSWRSTRPSRTRAASCASNETTGSTSTSSAESPSAVSAARTPDRVSAASDSGPHSSQIPEPAASASTRCTAGKAASRACNSRYFAASLTDSVAPTRVPSAFSGCRGEDGRGLLPDNKNPMKRVSRTARRGHGSVRGKLPGGPVSGGGADALQKRSSAPTPCMSPRLRPPTNSIGTSCVSARRTIASTRSTPLRVSPPQ